MATTKVRGELVDLNESTSESGLKIPSGTDVNRPTAAAGQIRNNTNETSEGSASCEEYYNGTEWKKINNVALPPPLAFKALLYTGNGSTQSITGAGFQPDLVWIKSRSNTYGHRLIDSTTGPDKYLESNSTAIQQGAGGAGLTSFDSDGFSVGSGNAHNANGATFVAWCLKGGGSGNTFNIDGTGYSTASAAGLDGGNINPTGASINTTAGFGIYTASPTTATQSISHGLNSTPDMYIFKTTNIARDWYVSFKDGATWRFGVLNSPAAFGTTTAYTANSSTMVIGGGSSVNEVVYAFHSVAGVSKFGTYTGNGSSSGPTVTTGFQPDFLMCKKTSGTANWWMVDSSRSTSNPINARLLANTTDAEVVFTPGNINFNSTGFELAGTSGEINGSGETYIYMAFKTN